MTYSQHEYDKKYYAEHAEEKRRKARERYQTKKNDPEFKKKNQEKASAWYAAHKEDPEVKAARLIRDKKWKEENREEWLSWRRERWAERMKDPSFVAQRRKEAAKYRAKKFGPYEDEILKAKEIGCIFCNESRPNCLDFQHIDPSTKRFGIATKALIPSLELLLEEIEKCIVICANCHRLLHAGELQIPVHLTDYTPTQRINGIVA